MPLKYAKGPVKYLYRDLPDKNGVIKRKKVKQILWGDWVHVVGPETGDWLNVTYGKKPYFMREDDLQDRRTLEIIFLDIGQGDACIVTEPGDDPNPRVMVVDAGIGSNTNGFLHWRFRDFDVGTLHAAIVTHPDKDHYYGFNPIFKNPDYTIEKVYHSGVVERTGDDLMGPVVGGYLTDVITTDSAIRAFYNDDANRGRKQYPKTIKAAMDNPKVGTIEALTTHHGTIEDDRTYMPGFAPSDDGLIDIEVLGPVIEPDATGQPRLRAFGSKPTSGTINDGKTKNGHSILLRLHFNGFRVLFGGDLNTFAETFLMQHYGEVTVSTPLDAADAEIDAIADAGVIETAAERFDVDLMKCCHHGSSDVTEEFLTAAAASAYVISSGDEEGHVHPRPDLLGLLGKTGDGPRPLLLSTELLRSTREKESPALRKKLDAVAIKIEEQVALGPDKDADLLKNLRAERKKLVDEAFKRNVGVYGAVNLRTDGETAIIAFRKEKSSATNRWFYYELNRAAQGNFIPELKGH